jgi:hypothetical protein
MRIWSVWTKNIFFEIAQTDYYIYKFIYCNLYFNMLKTAFKTVFIINLINLIKFSLIRNMYTFPPAILAKL